MRLLIQPLPSIFTPQQTKGLAKSLAVLMVLVRFFIKKKRNTYKYRTSRFETKDSQKENSYQTLTSNKRTPTIASKP